jgi:hypothetical protein
MSFRAQSFDNRRPLYATFLRFRDQPSGLHLIFEAGGKRFLYSYIRKNACSAFKRMIVDLSDAEPKPANEKERIRFLTRHHSARLPADLQRVDHSIFVYREPSERIVSLYKNKFIQRSGAADILASYREITGRTPEAASFTEFVTHYLRPGFRNLDAHVLPQRRQLLPIAYTDAIPMHELHAKMTKIVGHELADAYFRQKHNATANRPRATNVDNAHEESAETLHRIYLDTGGMPESELFLTAEIRARIGKLYKEDQVFSEPP